MIGLLNRKELTITYSMEKQAEIRQTLAANKIEYVIRTFDRGFHSRARTGSFGASSDFSREYVIYVHKDDYEKAIYLINKK